MKTIDQRRIEEAEAWAVGAFRGHISRQETRCNSYARTWLCSSPIGGGCGFRVTTVKGVILVNGGLGVLVVERPNTDMIAWLPGAINSLSYFTENVPAEIPTTEFHPDCVREWLADLREEDESPDDDTVENWKALGEAIDHEWSEHEIMTAVEEIVVDDFPNLTTWKMSFLRTREAIKWWLEHLPE